MHFRILAMMTIVDLDTQRNMGPESRNIRHTWAMNYATVCQYPYERAISSLAYNQSTSQDKKRYGGCML